MSPPAVSRRPPNSSHTNVARSYTYAAKVWALSVVQGPFSVAPRQTAPRRALGLCSRVGGHGTHPVDWGEHQQSAVVVGSPATLPFVRETLLEVSRVQVNIHLLRFEQLLVGQAQLSGHHPRQLTAARAVKDLINTSVGEPFTNPCAAGFLASLFQYVDKSTQEPMPSLSRRQTHLASDISHGRVTE